MTHKLKAGARVRYIGNVLALQGRAGVIVTPLRPSSWTRVLFDGDDSSRPCAAVNLQPCHGATVRILFANGSSDRHHFDSFSEAHAFTRESISYSGGKVSRVEITDNPGGGCNAVWDSSWDSVSNAAGLKESR